MRVACVEGAKELWLVFANSEHSESVSMDELERGISTSQLGVVFMNSKEVSPNICIVEEDNCTVRELR